MPPIDVPHLRWPFGLTAGSPLLQVVEQDTLAEVQQSVRLLLATKPGDRPLAPDVGVEDFVFTPHGVDPELLAARLEEMEDRASIIVTVSEPDGSGRQTVQVQVGLANDQETP